MLGSVAYAINDRGVVVGESTTAAPGYSHAFLWTKAAGMKDLGVLGTDPFGNNNSAATDINNRGVVVGRTTVDATTELWHAFAWTRRTGMVDITAGLEYTQALGTNNHNWVTGEGADADIPGGSFAVLWPGRLKVHNLGFGPVGFDEGVFGIGLAVSDAGHVVGSMSSPVAPFASGFLWTRKLGKKVDLNELVDDSAAGWRIVRAEDVNSKGQIVGSGCRLADHPNCQVQRAFLLNPKRRVK
jgi:probable HAF family extracellular repeat protein